jgi:hypothetical protein
MDNILKFKNSEDLSIPEIAIVIQQLIDLVNERKFGIIDKILIDNLNEKTSIILIVTLLRTTFCVADELENWSNLLESSKIWLRNRGANEQKILKGLNKA